MNACSSAENSGIEGACNPDTCDRGLCVDGSCDCDDGWSGDRCDEEMPFDMTVLIVILVLLVLALIVLVILVCVCCVMRNTGDPPPQTKPTPGPVTPAGPKIREVVLPPESVQVNG